MKFGSLFAGIGGMDLGLERAGMQCAWQVEIDEFCQKVLMKHWPDVPKFNDVRECGKHNLERVDLIAGGFPCQPFSIAGNKRGKHDDRYLWPEMLRIIREIRPTWVIGENVAGIINLALEVIYADLEAENYELESLLIPACGLTASHKRERIFILAHSSLTGLQACGGNGLRTGQRHRKRPVARKSSTGDFPDWAGGTTRQPSPLTEIEDTGGREVERDFRGVAHGVSRRMDRLRTLGNAVVPAVVEVIGKEILKGAKNELQTGT